MFALLGLSMSFCLRVHLQDIWIWIFASLLSAVNICVHQHEGLICMLG